MKKSFYKSMVSIFALLGTLNSGHAMEEEERGKSFAHMGAIFGAPPPALLRQNK